MELKALVTGFQRLKRWSIKTSGIVDIGGEE